MDGGEEDELAALYRGRYRLTVRRDVRETFTPDGAPHTHRGDSSPGDGAVLIRFGEDMLARPRRPAR